jgi:uncharacterized protein
LGATYPFWVEPRWLERTRHRVPLPKIDSPLRVLHLSDLHASYFVSLDMIEQAIALGLAARPDLICLTGDYISHQDVPDPKAYARVLRRLSAAAPTYAVLGNHDGGAWAEQAGGFSDHRYVEGVLNDARIPLLHNRAVPVEVRSQPLWLVGAGDYWSAELDGSRAFAGVNAQDWPVVLLSHNPDSKDLLADHPWDLMLSGHTHGGQVIVPLYGAPFVAVRDRRYVAGLKPWGTRQVHVTRGVGNLLGVRLNCRPEVSVLELSPALRS